MARRRLAPRITGIRSYNRLFVVVAEGCVTEPKYFNILKRRYSTALDIKCLKKGDRSAPTHVLKRIKQYLNNISLREGDQAWLVIDRDNWKDEQLRPLIAWQNEADNRGVAVSNPKFEYWLLLHFEDGYGINSARGCDDRLKRHLPDYDKQIVDTNFSLEMMGQAVERARQRDTPPCKDWPRTTGTTVYRLVQEILKMEREHQRQP